MRRIVIVVCGAALLGITPALATSSTLPGGTSLAVDIASPASGAILPAGSVGVEGTASVGSGTAVKDESVAFVLDVSGSTNVLSGVDCDATPGSDSILACEKAAVMSVNADAVGATSPVANAGVGVFNATGTALDVDPVAGTQLLTAPGPNIDAVVASLSAGGGTSFVAGVTAANAILSDAAAAPVKLLVFFSDGQDTIGGTLPAIPSETVVRAFAIGGAGCAGASISLNAVAALGAAGSSCTQVTDLSVLDDVIGAQIGSSLDALELSIDGGAPAPIANADIDPDLPQDGPAAVTYATTVTLESGPHQLCVTATGTDAGGGGSATDCTDVEVADAVVDCAVETCEATATDGNVATAAFKATGITKQVGLRAVDTTNTECGGTSCVTGFDVLFDDTGGQAKAQLLVKTARGQSTPFWRAAVYLDGVKVTRSCLFNHLRRSEKLPCKIIGPTLSGGTFYYVKFNADPGFRFR